MAARSNDRVLARNRARERRLALDADRRRRDERVDESVAAFDLASADRDAALTAAAACEAVMGEALVRVLREGESVERTAALCEVSAGEVRRLTRLAAADPQEVGDGHAAELADNSRAPAEPSSAKSAPAPPSAAA